MLKKLISYYKNNIKLFIVVMISSFLLSLLNIAYPIITRNIIDVQIKNDNIEMIIILCGVLLGVYLLRLTTSFIVNYHGHVLGTTIERDMRIDLFKQVQTFDTEFFDNTKTGKLMSYIVSHLRDVSEMVHHVPENIIMSSVMIIGSFIYLTTIHFTFVIIMYTMLTILFIYSFNRRKKMLNASRKTRKTHEIINSETENSLGGIRLTKAFTNEDFEIEKFSNTSNLYLSSFKNFYKQMGVFSAGNSFIIDLTYLSILITGSYLLINNEITYGDFTAFLILLAAIIQPIRLIISTIEQINSGWSGYEKYNELMETIPEIKNSKNPIIAASTMKTDIEFKHVNYKYKTNNELILKDFNLVIKQGNKTALVGETGVGKSTISKLIPRFYDVLDGEIHINNTNIKDYDIYSLRSIIGHVQQDVYIFFGTISENILYGRPEATQEEIIDAAKKANIHEFIMTLDDGYDTLVGERGVKLSGGQKQRISIARVFLKNPPILILDEATSSLDNVTEKLIQESLDELTKGRTTLVIAHRLSTIKNADDIIVLDETGIIERGTHEQLIENNGYYQRLHSV